MVETTRTRVEHQLTKLSLLVTGRLASWIGVVFWVAVVAAAIPFAARLSSVESSRITEFLPAGADSTRALDLDRSFPSGRAPDAEVVFYRPSGLTSADMARARSAGQALVSRLRDDIDAPSAPVRSANGKVAVVSVPVLGDENAVLQNVTRLRSVLGTGRDGLEIRVSGQAAIQADLLGAFSGADTLLLVATAGLVMVLLALTYRSPVLWIVPLACVGIAEGLAQAIIYGLARGGLTVNAESTSLVTVIVFGAGTDYALLLTARYREELRRHPEHRRAMVVAWRRAAPAVVVASSVTVAATLACLLPAKLSLTSGFGIVGIVGVLTAAFVILAAYPALLLVMGRGVFWPIVPRHVPDFVQRGMWVRLGHLVSRGHRPVWIAGFVILGGTAVAVLTVNTNVSSLSELPPSAQSVQGYTILAGNFPAGEVSPVDVVVTDSRTLDTVRGAMQELPITAAVGPAEHAAGMARFDLILSVSPNGNTGFNAIRTLRATAARVAPGRVVIGGQTAQDLDTAVASHHDTLLVVPSALAVVLVVLWLLLRAIAGPLLVVITVVATFGAALGLASAVVVPLLHLPGTDPTVPLLTFVFLVALGVDYNIFLLTRVREEVLRRGATAGVDTGVASTGAVLTSAGVILAGTFSVLAVLPIVASREIGIVVAIGVLADTFLVRTILVPMLMADMKSRFWWPSRPAPEVTAEHEAVGRG